MLLGYTTSVYRYRYSPEDIYVCNNIVIEGCIDGDSGGAEQGFINELLLCTSRAA